MESPAKSHGARTVATPSRPARKHAAASPATPRTLRSGAAAVTEPAAVVEKVAPSPAQRSEPDENALRPRRQDVNYNEDDSSSENQSDSTGTDVVAAREPPPRRASHRFRKNKRRRPVVESGASRMTFQHVLPSHTCAMGFS